jgi:hypothetical protein
MDEPTPDPPQDSEKEKPDAIARRLDETLERLARFEREMPRLFARIAAGLNEPKAAPQPPAKPDDRIAALEKALQDEQGRRIRTERENQIRAAVASAPWVDPEDAVRELLSKAAERDGKLVVVDPQSSFGEALPLEDAVKNLAQRKPHWIKAEVKGGSGASGGSASGSHSSSVDWDGVKYRDLKSNPLLMQRAISEKGQAWVASLHDKWRAKQAAKPTFHI